MNIGHSCNLIYDTDTFRDHVIEETSQVKYRLDANQIFNCDQCLSTLGPRSDSPYGQGVSTWLPIGHPVATSQALIDIDSILSNRNVKESRSKTGGFNYIDVTKFPLKNMKICNDFLNPLSSRLSYPAANYRDMAVDRFYNLNQNPQLNIFWNFAINTNLEAKDNYIESLPKLQSPQGLPVEIKGANNYTHYVSNAYCGK